MACDRNSGLGQDLDVAFEQRDDGLPRGYDPTGLVAPGRRAACLVVVLIVLIVLALVVAMAVLLLG